MRQIDPSAFLRLFDFAHSRKINEWERRRFRESRLLMSSPCNNQGKHARSPASVNQNLKFLFCGQN
jgi:hypothetical protein